MVELLGADHPFAKQVLDGKTPEARAKELIEGTKLGDVAYRKNWPPAGMRDRRSTDPMILVAREIDAAGRELRTRFESEVTGVER